MAAPLLSTIVVFATLESSSSHASTAVELTMCSRPLLYPLPQNVLWVLFTGGGFSGRELERYLDGANRVSSKAGQQRCCFL